MLSHQWSLTTSINASLRRNLCNQASPRMSAYPLAQAPSAAQAKQHLERTVRVPRAPLSASCRVLATTAKMTASPYLPELPTWPETKPIALPMRAPRTATHSLGEAIDEPYRSTHPAAGVDVQVRERAQVLPGHTNQVPWP